MNFNSYNNITTCTVHIQILSTVSIMSFTSFFFPSSRSHSGSCIAFNYHVSSVSCKWKHLLNLYLSLLTLPFWKSMGQTLYRIFVNIGLSETKMVGSVPGKTRWGGEKQEQEEKEVSKSTLGGQDSRRANLTQSHREALQTV